MIIRNTTSTVNFFVADSDGLPATGKAASITATISMNGDSASATTISETISEIDSTEQPGWYRFNYPFYITGNAFITFTCTGCKIMPWEDDVIDVYAQVPSAQMIASAVWADTATYDSPVSGTPGRPGAKGYYQVNAPISNPWTILAEAGTQQVTYGDIIKSRVASTELSAAKTDIINAMPSVSGLSTFNASTDAVTVNSSQLAPLAKSTELSSILTVLNSVKAGVLNWVVSGNTLTIKDDSGTSLRTYTLTRDTAGNIIKVEPN